MYDEFRGEAAGCLQTVDNAIHNTRSKLGSAGSGSEAHTWRNWSVERQDLGMQRMRVMRSGEAEVPIYNSWGITHMSTAMHNPYIIPRHP